MYYIQPNLALALQYDIFSILAKIFRQDDSRGHDTAVVSSIIANQSTVAKMLAFPLRQCHCGGDIDRRCSGMVRNQCHARSKDTAILLVFLL